MATKDTKYHIALDSQGYVLAGSPTSPKRTMERAPVFGNRFATGDRDFTDLSLWWYWAQTDWSGGFKDNPEWKDDAKYYFSTNIDAYNKVGSISLSFDIVSENDFNDTIKCGITATVAGVSNKYVGTHEASGDDICNIYKEDSGWSEILGANVNSGQEDCVQLLGHKDNLWAIFSSSINTVCLDYDGSSWTDHTAAINAASTMAQITNGNCMAEIVGSLYALFSNGITDDITMMKTDDNGSNWTEVFYKDEFLEGVDMIEYNGDIYYLLTNNTRDFIELRIYDISASADKLIKRFNNVNLTITEALGGKMLFNMGNNLVITIPDKEIWEYNASTNLLQRIYEQDSVKKSIGTEAYGYIDAGGIEKGPKIFWGNLIYDGTYFYNNIKDADDDTTKNLYPIYIGSDDIIYWISSNDTTALFKDSTTVFKSGADKNFIQFSEEQTLSTIEKLVHSVTLIFDAFDTGEEIEVQYSTDGGSTFTVLGQASATLDGTSVTQKELLFGIDVTYTKIIFRVFLNGDGTSTPTLKDISLKYLPIPDYKYSWSFNIDASNSIVLMDRKSQETKKGIDIRHALRTSFLKKEILVFEDVDYAENQLNEALDSSETEITLDDASSFPEQGRIKIEDEEILYTGKTKTTLTGCTRGYRGTNAVAHNDDTAVTNKYNILITDYKESTPLSNEASPEEFIVALQLIET